MREWVILLGALAVTGAAYAETGGLPDTKEDLLWWIIGGLMTALGVSGLVIRHLWSITQQLNADLVSVSQKSTEAMVSQKAVLDTILQLLFQLQPHPNKDHIGYKPGD